MFIFNRTKARSYELKTSKVESKIQNRDFDYQVFYVNLNSFLILYEVRRV